MEYQFSCQTRGNGKPTFQKPRVYFTCHPKDFKLYFQEICGYIFKTRDCEIFYTEDMNADLSHPNTQTDLERMNLFVIPVTTRLLTQKNRAMDSDFPFALEKGIPVLPVLMEHEIDELYAKPDKFGDLQYLDPYNSDLTAISFEVKLEKYLESILIGDELAQRVRHAFDGQIFLSYRKMDRKYANDLMKQIHKNPEIFDIAIWFDEFLTPGESFNQNIEASIEKSKLFALLVTKNLLKKPNGKPNYIMEAEYPMAKAANIMIFPAKMEEVSQKELSLSFPEIPEAVSAQNEEKFRKNLLSSLKKESNSAKEKDSEHNYLIGLAYLTGIDVEVDAERANFLITKAAQADNLEAMKKLVQMYQTGEGVKRDYSTAIEWQKKIVAHWKKIYYESGREEDENQYAIEITKLGDDLYDIGKLSEAKECYEKSLEIRLKLAEETETVEARRDLAISYDRLGGIFEFEAQQTGAKEYISEAREDFEKSFKISLKLTKETETEGAYRNLSYSYMRLGDISKLENNLNEAREYYEKSHEILFKLAEKTETVEGRRDLAMSYTRLGDIAESEGHLAEAREYYEKSLEIRLKLAEETGTVETRRDLSGIYEQLGCIAKLEENIIKMFEYYEKSHEIILKLAEETEMVDDLEIESTEIVEVLKSKWWTYFNLLNNAISQGRRSEVREFFEKFLEIELKLAEKEITVEDFYKLSTNYECFGEIAESEGVLTKAREFYKKSLEIDIKFIEETKTIEGRRYLSGKYERLGDIAEAESKRAEACKYYEKSFEIRWNLMKESGTAESYDDLAFSYYKLGCVEDSSTRGEISFFIAFMIWRALAEFHPDVSKYRKLCDNCELLAILL